MLRKILKAVSRLLRSEAPSMPANDEMIRRETARATSDIARHQGGL
ncbi:MAG: hypothetical protein ACI9AO_001823 [Ilumatobacter sp.]|jgi:hypothetical protein